MSLDRKPESCNESLSPIGHSCHNESLLPIGEKCCTATTGCEWDGTLRRVVTEPIFVQKVYDATLFNLQALSTVNNVSFTPSLPSGSVVENILDIKCRKFFNPSNVDDIRNFCLDPETTLSGGEFLKDKHGKYVEVVGPDGLTSERLIYADTEECDSKGKGTPIFGTQKVKIRGNVVITLKLRIRDHRGRRSNIKLTANVPIAPANSPLVLTNFFELCMPSVDSSAYFPRFAEICNVSCETRLATNNVSRDFLICPDTGTVRADLIIALCATCEKKIIVPTQLCVLSTGFPELSPSVSPICTTFPSLFPNQIDESSIGGEEEGDGDCRPIPRSEAGNPFSFSLHED